MDIKSQIAALARETIVSCFPEAAVPEADSLRQALSVPPDPAMGDYALPVFSMAKVLRMAPPKIAQRVAEGWQHSHVARVENVNGYVNFFLNRENFAHDSLTDILAKGERFGSSDMGSGKTICLDYSSINICKLFHIGHLSTTMIGNSLKRIYDFLGYKTVGINHLGDWGTQFGKMISAYKRWGSREEVEKGGVEELARLYVKFHKEAESDPALEDEGRHYFRLLEEGDPECTQLWNWFKDLTLADAQKVYEKLGVTFDSYAGESFYNDKMDRVVDELNAKGLLEISDGASVVNLGDTMPPCIILRSDGATLYATRDLAAALYRHDTYHFDKCLYVVAYQQDLHFSQVFKVLEKMGYDWAHDCVHVAFGMVSFEGQSLSTREGHVVYLKDLLNQAQEKALAIIEEKSPNLPNKEDVARQVGIGAVVYADLSNNRIKDIDFSWERALSFDGETGPYVQYTHARCCSVLRKAVDAGIPTDGTGADYTALTDDESQSLLRLMERFPDVIAEAAARYEPSLITRAVTDIAKSYNKFYYEHRILDGEPGEIAARVALTGACRSVIKTGLWLIGIESPERM